MMRKASGDGHFQIFPGHAPFPGSRSAWRTAWAMRVFLRVSYFLIADDVPLSLSVLKALLRKNGVNDVEPAVDGPQLFSSFFFDNPLDLLDFPESPNIFTVNCLRNAKSSKNERSIS